MDNEFPKIVKLMAEKPWCYYIPEGQSDEHGYIPSIVIKDHAGHYPMSGNGEWTLPWYWGATRDEAMQVAIYQNKKLGITEEQMEEIVGSSMWASTENHLEEG
jgi:hypothetical protein